MSNKNIFSIQNARAIESIGFLGNTFALLSYYKIYNNFNLILMVTKFLSNTYNLYAIISSHANCLT